MATILILAGGTMGRVNTSRRLAIELVRKGHAVAIASPADIGDRIGDFPGEFLTLPKPSLPVGSEVDRGLAARIRRQLASPLRWRRLASRRQVKLDALGLDVWQTLLADRAPDIVVADLELPAHVMTAIGAGRKVVLWTTMLSVWRRPGLPPLHTSIAPGDRPWGTELGVAVAWWRFSVWKWFRSRRLWFTRAGEDQRSMMRRVAHSVGFDWGRVDEYEWLLPFTFRDLPTLDFNAFEIEFPHEPHPWVRYVGPQLGDIDPVMKSDPPLIYAGFGAWHRGDDSGVIEAVIQAVRRRPEWRLVIGLGGRRPPEGLPEATNVEIHSWAPQSEMLARASVAIHHAGINTVNECVATGTPMLAIPFDYGDTPGAASRVRHHGLGIVLEREAVDADVVEAAIDELLTDPYYGERVREMQKAFSQYEGRAVEAIEDQLS